MESISAEMQIQLSFYALTLFYCSLCMRHINIAMERMNNSSEVKSEEHISIVERILQKTNNPKIAAVLALDLIMVGVDTVCIVSRVQR